MVREDFVNRCPVIGGLVMVREDFVNRYPVIGGLVMVRGGKLEMSASHPL